MKYSIQHIAAAVKAARKQKRLSQRELSAKTGIPQGHISKIENAVIDLQVSTLIELSRVLDLELMLVPRTLVPIVQALQKKPEGRNPRPMYVPEEDTEEQIS